MAESESETDRVYVRTYVPAYQRDRWDEHAEALDMSRSEFVRTMVQAGREFFDEGSAGGAERRDAPEPSPGSTTGATAGDDLEAQVLDALAGDAYLSWDELVAAVTDDIEQRLEDALQELQADDAIRYSGPNGGYTLDEQ